MKGESAYLATRTGCVAVIRRMPQFHADKLPVPLRRIPASSCQRARSRSKNGVPERIRTSDLRFRKPLLYPAELRGRDGRYSIRCLWRLLVSRSARRARWTSFVDEILAKKGQSRRSAARHAPRFGIAISSITARRGADCKRSPTLERPACRRRYWYAAFTVRVSSSVSSSVGFSNSL